MDCNSFATTETSDRIHSEFFNNEGRCVGKLNKKSFSSLNQGEIYCTKLLEKNIFARNFLIVFARVNFPLMNTR